MAEGSRANARSAIAGASMGDMLPPAAKSPPALGWGDDPTRPATGPARIETSFRELSQMVGEFSHGLLEAKLANEHLLEQLGALGELLGSARTEQVGLEHRVGQLEHELAVVKQEAERDRRFLIEQQDAFLAALLEEQAEALGPRDEHDEDGPTQRLGPNVADLSQKLVQAETARELAESALQRAREALAKAQAERDEAQARAEKRERERDELRAEASQLRARLGTTKQPSAAPPPANAPRPPSYRPPLELALDAAELDATLPARAPALPNVAPRFSPPPPELAGAVYSPRPDTLTPPGPGPASGRSPPPASAEPSSPALLAAISAASLPPGPSIAPALKQKPAPATRPLIDYSLGGDGVLPETLEGARFPSKPPRK